MFPKINTIDINKDVEELTVLKLDANLKNNEFVKLVTWKDTIKSIVSNNKTLTTRINKDEMSKLHKLNVINLDTNALKSNSRVNLDQIREEEKKSLTTRSRVIGHGNKCKDLEQYFAEDMVQLKKNVTLCKTLEKRIVVTQPNCRIEHVADENTNNQVNSKAAREYKKVKSKTLSFSDSQQTDNVMEKFNTKSPRFKKNSSIVKNGKNSHQIIARAFDEDSLDSNNSDETDNKSDNESCKKKILSLKTRKDNKIKTKSNLTANDKLIEETNYLLVKDKKASPLNFDFLSPLASIRTSAKQRNGDADGCCNNKIHPHEDEMLYSKLISDLCELESLDGQVVNKHNDALSTARSQFYSNIRKCHSDICIKKKSDSSLLTATELDLTKFKFDYEGCFPNDDLTFEKDFFTKSQLLDAAAGNFIELFKSDTLSKNCCEMNSVFRTLFIDCVPRKKRRLNDNTEERIYVKDDYSHEYINDKEDNTDKNMQKKSPDITQVNTKNRNESPFNNASVIPLNTMLNLLGICEKPPNTYLPVIEEVSNEGVSVNESSNNIEKRFSKQTAETENKQTNDENKPQESTKNVKSNNSPSNIVSLERTPNINSFLYKTKPENTSPSLESDLKTKPPFYEIKSPTKTQFPLHKSNKTAELRYDCSKNKQKSCIEVPEINDVVEYKKPKQPLVKISPELKHDDIKNKHPNGLKDETTDGNKTSSRHKGRKCRDGRRFKRKIRKNHNDFKLTNFDKTLDISHGSQKNDKCIKIITSQEFSSNNTPDSDR